MKYLVASTLLIGLLVSCGEEKDDKKEAPKQEITNVEVKSVGELSIGYYNLESITTDFNLYSETKTRMEKKAAAIEAEMKIWSDKGVAAQTRLEQGMANQTLTDNQGMALQQTIQNCQNELMKIQQQKYEPYQQEAMRIDNVLSNKLDQYGKEFSKKHGIKLFLTYAKGGGVTYVDESFDMTDEFIAYMNKEEDKLNKESK